MKKLFILLAAAFALAAWPAAAQQSVPVKIYPLTNSLQFNVATGGNAIATTVTSNILSQPFPVWRGRGYTFNTSFIPGSSSVSNVTFTVRYASVTTLGGVTATNWSTAGNVTTIAAPCNGTARVWYSYTVPPTAVDNVQLGQLYTIQNAALSTVTVDPTNTFISVFP